MSWPRFDHSILNYFLIIQP